MADLLTGMAGWHGRYWDDPALARPPFAHRTPDAFVANLARFARLRRRGRVGARRARMVIPDAVVPRYDDLYSALWRSLELTAEGPLTLLHGEPHIGNVYRTGAGRMGITDWQLVMRGSWAYDVAYAIVTGLTVEDRRAWERDLLGSYLGRLTATGVAAPDFDDAWLAYRQQTLWPYFGRLLATGRSLVQPRFPPDPSNFGMLERAANAVLDLDALGAVLGAPRRLGQGREA